MPSRSRARNNVSLLRSQIANANMPLNRSRQRSPHSSHACTITSVSHRVRNMCPRAAQLDLDFLEVVDLSVVGDDDAVVFVVERLLAAFEIDDRQSTMTQTDTGLDMKAVAIGATVFERRVHAREQIRIDRTPCLQIDNAGNATHELCSPSRLTRSCVERCVTTHHRIERKSFDHAVSPRAAVTCAQRVVEHVRLHCRGERIG